MSTSTNCKCSKWIILPDCHTLTNLFQYTVDLEIFVVKIFLWFAQTTKKTKKKHETYLTTDDHYGLVRTISQHS